MAKKILVVDDQKSMCWILSKILVDAGFTVQVAHNGAEALEMLHNGAIAALVVDYRLPDINGFELFDQVKEKYAALQKQYSGPPAVLITSYGSKELKEQALEKGFAAYLDKPFKNETFIATLRRII